MWRRLPSRADRWNGGAVQRSCDRKRQQRLKPRACARAALLVGAVAVLGGCERGCARRYAEHLLSPGSSEIPRPGSDLPSTATCPDALARCTGGHVVAAARPPPDMRCSPEGCACPWDDLGACATGCVAEGLELDVARERALTQMCAPKPGAESTFAIAVAPGSIPAADGRTGGSTRPMSEQADEDTGVEERPFVEAACEIEKYRCDGGVVFACEGGRISLFRCLHNCAEEGSTVLASVSPAQAAALLCRR